MSRLFNGEVVVVLVQLRNPNFILLYLQMIGFLFLFFFFRMKNDEQLDVREG